jgi:hypothetical protein
MTIEDQIKQSKDWRQRLDAILQEMKAQQLMQRKAAWISPAEAGRHLSLSITHLEDTIMRQGMCLKAINEATPGTSPNPYPESYNPANTQVEPTADGIKL